MATSRREFPPSLNGGEQSGFVDHRVGETERRNPDANRVDPGVAERDLENRSHAQDPDA